MSKRFEERNKTLRNQPNDFQKTKKQQPFRGSSQNRGQSRLSLPENIGNFRGRFRGNKREFRKPRLDFQRLLRQNQNHNSYTPQQLPQQFFSYRKLFSSHRPENPLPHSLSYRNVFFCFRSMAFSFF